MPTPLPTEQRTRHDRAAIATLAATTTAGYGVLFYAYGVLLVPMQADLGWSRAFLSGVFSAALVVGALSTLAVGGWLDRHPPRPLFLLGGAAASLLVTAWAASASRPMFVATWLLLGMCQAVLFYEPAFTVLTKWFRGHQRTRAITTVTLMAGLASTIFGPLTAALEQALGWRGAVLVLGAILAGVTLPGFALGLERGRAPAPDDGPDPAPSTVPRDAFLKRSFWLLTAAYLLSSVTTFGIAVHLVPFLTGRGMGTGAAATALGAVGLMQVLGRGTYVRLSARRPAVQLATWVLAAKAAGLALLLLVPGTLGVIAFVLVYGAANGATTLTRATSIAELYGPDHYGSISAVVASVGSVGGALAPFGVAAAAALVGSETPVLWGLVAFAALAAVANELVARPSGASHSRLQ